MLLLTTLLLLTLLIALPAYTIYRPPHLLIRYFQHRWPDTLWHVAVPAGPGTRPTIALTIDDAPSAYTGEILQVLKANDAKATFFVIGAQIAAAAAAGPGGGQGMLENLVREGMELGNHAMSDRPSRDLSDAVLEAEVLGVQGWIERVYDRVFQDQDHGDGNGVRRHHFFRPGSGFFSERMRTLIHRLGLRIALGSVYPHDAQISWPRVNAWHILSMVRSGDIIVCHDRRGWTVPMLKRVLPELKRRGFRVVTLSELVELGEQTAARKS
ncbi:chitin deacetylase CDA4 [Aspergillus homomorphus CBS 101889]|uniref:chitin deacetylase n=1 Tax=Aspergillus homomorphus (strain CBS 101889) TaxID=1450537 RepID=A0A395I1I5_ASPHC|nr:glycoside hydrolase/deacetylase [Aspergillus homomorphus CBS 101889]RAL14042.1 glycoside hydrolase/deacetylase [Aspergillus homomorphus CBS 101889]